MAKKSAHANLLENLMSATGNEYAAFVDDGIESSDVAGYYDTGSYALNALISGSIYGGIPSNKITCFAGETTTGKTFIALSTIKEFLDAHPNGIVLFFDSESAVTSTMFKDRGIDPKRVVVLPVTTVEEFRFQAIKILDTYIEDGKDIPVLMVLDSLGNLSTNKELEDTSEGKDTVDMTRAKIIKATMRVLTLRVGKANIPLIITNHTYNTQEKFSKKIVSGGTGLQYVGSSIVILSKSKVKDGTDLVGVSILCRMYKSRFTKEGSSCRMGIDFSKGLMTYDGLVDIGVAGGVLKKVSKKIEFPDGSKAFEKAIYKDPEKYFTEDVLAAIDEAAKKVFCYGSELDSMILDVEEENE